jgi:hypothetical protein
MSTFGLASGPVDSSVQAAERLMQLKRIQRRSGTSLASSVASASSAVMSSWNEPQGPASNLQDAPLEPLSSRGVAHLSSEQNLVKALKDTVRFLRSSATDPGAFVDPSSYHAGGSHMAEAMTELLKELEALKSRDASSATVLRMAKENLEQRKQQIDKLQDELDRQQSKNDRSADRQLQETILRENAAMDQARELESANKKLQSDLDAALDQEQRLYAQLREAQAQHDQEREDMQHEMEVIRSQMTSKRMEMDHVLEEAAEEVSGLRSGMFPVACTMLSPPPSISPHVALIVPSFLMCPLAFIAGRF